MNILFATLVLGLLGLVFGLLLTIASKKFHVEVDPRIEEVRSCLAGANCGACGYPGCDACAEAVVKGKVGSNCCPPGGNAAATKIAAIMGVEAQESEPMVACVMCQGSIGFAQDRYTYDGYKSCRAAAGIAGGPKDCHFSCIGLGDCMDHCMFDAIHVKGGVAKVDPTKCTACGACIENCPRKVIRLVPVSARVRVTCSNGDSAKLANGVCLRSCLGCGRCVRTCKQEAISIVDGHAQIDYTKCTRCGDCAAVCAHKCIVIS